MFCNISGQIQNQQYCLIQEENRTFSDLTLDFPSVASHAVGYCINEEKVICYQFELALMTTGAFS